MADEKQVKSVAARAVDTVLATTNTNVDEVTRKRAERKVQVIFEEVVASTALEVARQLEGDDE